MGGPRRDDVEVITPNPFTSGGARWNIMAAYGQALENGASEDEALAFVGDVLGNTVVQDASAVTRSTRSWAARAT